VAFKFPLTVRFPVVVEEIFPPLVLMELVKEPVVVAVAVKAPPLVVTGALIEKLGPLTTTEPPFV